MWKAFRIASKTLIRGWKTLARGGFTGTGEGEIEVRVRRGERRGCGRSVTRHQVARAAFEVALGDAGVSYLSGGGLGSACRWLERQGRRSRTGGCAGQTFAGAVHRPRCRVGCAGCWRYRLRVDGMGELLLSVENGDDLAQGVAVGVCLCRAAVATRRLAHGVRRLGER